MSNQWSTTQSQSFTLRLTRLQAKAFDQDEKVTVPSLELVATLQVSLREKNTRRKKDTHVRVLHPEILEIALKRILIKWNCKPLPMGELGTSE